MKRIIIIDDDAGIQEAFETLLYGSGHEVMIYSDGNKILLEDHIPADLYIIDKQLSGVDGLEVCKHLKSQPHTKHIPVIMLSASPSILPLSKLAGADDAIEKPFSVEVISKKIEQYLGVNSN